MDENAGILIMDYEEFKKTFDEKIGAMSDKELREALRKAGCKFENEDETESGE